VCKVHVFNDGRSSKGVDAQLTSKVDQLMGAAKDGFHPELPRDLQKVEYN
jgi:hypothetical protein